MITGAQLFVKALKKENVKHLFAYPGGQAIDLFDALYGEKDIEIILPRHEQGLGHAADGYARSTGKVGVCLVTSGPGATNLVTAIATANYDAVPMVCFTGQVPTSLIGNDAFQEVDIVGCVRNITKYAVTVRDRESLGAIIRKAFVIAATGKPGVVLVDIPKDIQKAEGSEEYPETVELRGYKPSVEAHPGQIKRALRQLKLAKKPLILAGGGVRISGAEGEFREFCEKVGAPVVTTVMGKGAIATDHPLYFGNVGIHGSFAANAALTECDLLFSIGTRFNDRVVTGRQSLAKDAKIVHIDVDPASISRNVAVDIPIVCDAKHALEALLPRCKPVEADEWLDRIRQLKKEYPIRIESDRLTPQDVIERLNEDFEELIVATDVGQNQLWTTQFLKLNEKRKLLTSGGLGTMGYGLPAAIGAKLGNPDVPVVAVAGDGGFQMNVQELATAAVNHLPVIVCLFNNGWLGNVRQWQELYYGKRYQSTCLKRRNTCPVGCNCPAETCPAYIPDFMKLAESYGAKGMRITEKSQLKEAFAFAKAQKQTVILEFMIAEEENVYPIVLPGQPLSTIKFGKEN